MTRAQIDNKYNLLNSHVETLYFSWHETVSEDEQTLLGKLQGMSTMINEILFDHVLRDSQENEKYFNLIIYSKACICQIETTKKIQSLCKTLHMDCRLYSIEKYCALLGSAEYRFLPPNPPLTTNLLPFPLEQDMPLLYPPTVTRQL